MTEDNKSIFRIKKNKKNPYVMINKKALIDKTLSWKAKGLLSYLMSLPDDWKIYLTELSKHSSNGKSSLYSGIQELIRAGYITKKEVRNKKGQIKGCEYTVHEKPYRGNPHAVKPDTVNRPLLNNNNKLNNNKTVGCQSSNVNILTSFDGVQSIQLYMTIKDKRKIQRKVEIKQWILQLQKFRSKSNIKKKRIKSILTWYCKHFGELYVPKAYSMNTFCNKFLQIEDAMERDIEQEEKGEKKTKYKVRRKK